MKRDAAKEARMTNDEKKLEIDIVDLFEKSKSMTHDEFMNSLGTFFKEAHEKELRKEGKSDAKEN